jgi:hypothetical protein
VEKLLGDSNSADQCVSHLFRACAICSNAVFDQRELSEFYATKALEILRRASDAPGVPTPRADDPELAVIAEREEFKAILSNWQQNGQHPTHPASK